MNQYPEWVIQRSHKRMHDDFRLFLFYIWKELKLPPPTEVQNDIAVYLQGGPRRRIIQAFRGVGKSWITAAYVLWLLYRDPQHKIMVVSASKERADAFSIFVKRLIEELDLLRFLEPRANQRSSNIAFDVGPAAPDQSPSVKSVGITGQLTGSRADTIVADDIEIPKNSATEAQREKLGELVKEFDAVLKPDGEIVYLGTPQVAQSLYSRDNLQSRGYQCRVWPAQYTDGIDEDGNDTYGGTLAPLILDALLADGSLAGMTTEPSRFSDIDLSERQASYGRSGFALQFMLDTSLNDANRYPLKLRDLIVMDCDKDVAPVQLTWASGAQQVIEDLPPVGLNGDRYHAPMYISKDHFLPYQGKVMFIDPSGRGKDKTAYVVVKMLKGMLYVTAWGGLTGGYDDETLETLAEIAKAQEVNEIHIEANWGDGMFTSLFSPVLNRIYPCTVEEYKVTGQKEVRIIDKLEPALNQHRVVMDRSVIEEDYRVATDDPKFSGAYQLTHLTRDRQSLRHDDMVDVLAEAVGYYTSMIDNKVKEAEKQHEAKLQDEALRKFLKRARATGPFKKNRNFAGL